MPTSLFCHLFSSHGNQNKVTTVFILFKFLNMFSWDEVRQIITESQKYFIIYILVLIANNSTCNFLIVLSVSVTSQIMIQDFQNFYRFEIFKNSFYCFQISPSRIFENLHLIENALKSWATRFSIRLVGPKLKMFAFSNCITRFCAFSLLFFFVQNFR